MLNVLVEEGLEGAVKVGSGEWLSVKHKLGAPSNALVPRLSSDALVTTSKALVSSSFLLLLAMPLVPSSDALCSE